MQPLEQRPAASVILSDLVTRDKWQTCQGVAFPIAASDIHAGSEGDYDGRFHDAFDGCIHGGTTVQNVDTAIDAGTTVGTPILVTSGAPWYSPWTKAKGTLWADGTAAAMIGGTVTMTASEESALIEINRGMYPADATVAMTNANFYTDLILMAGSTGLNFKLHMPSCGHVQLQQTNDGGTTWRTVFTAPGIYDTETFLNQHDRRLLIKILPEYGNRSADVLRIEMNNGYFLRVSPVDDAGYPVALGNIGPFRLEGKAGMASLNRYILRFGAVKAKRTVKTGAVQNFADTGGSTPSVSVNGRVNQQDAQTNSTAITDLGGGNYGVSVNASHPDDGTGNGSKAVPVLSDMTFLLPFGWADSIPGVLLPYPALQMYPLRVEIDEYLDDIQRTAVTMATLYFDNRHGFWDDWVGQRAVNIAVANKGVLVSYSALVGGVGTSGVQCISTPQGRIAIMHCECSSIKLKEGVKCGRQYDNWAMCDAVRWEAQLGQIHPQYLTGIPIWNPRGGTAREFGPDCPFYILSPGSAAQPAHEYLPNVAPWTVLQGFAADTGTTDGPNYMGIQQPSGNLFFGTYNPNLHIVSAAFSGFDMHNVQVCNSIADLRSEIDIQTINPITYELNAAHIDMPASIKQRIGYHRGWLERQARFGTNLAETAYNAQRVASLNSQTIGFDLNMLVPGLHVGMTMTIYDCPGLTTAQNFYTTHVRTVMGYKDVIARHSGLMDCYQSVSGRNVNSF